MLRNVTNYPLVSIVIPSYNEDKYIKKCLTSLLNQTYKNLEMILIDDGSTDKTRDIIRKFNVLLIELNHGGAGRARNIGASKSKGEILVFLDADMIYEKNYIYNVILPIIKRETVSTYTTAEYVANYNNIWAKCWNINANLPINIRIRKSNKTNRKEALPIRAILKSHFLSTYGFNPSWGYLDDRSLSKYNIIPKKVNNAVCYHFNPESLKEVYFSARWIGRSKRINGNIKELLRYCILNSLRNAYNKIRLGAPYPYILFKIIFDLGYFYGMIFRNTRRNYSK